MKFALLSAMLSSCLLSGTFAADLKIAATAVNALGVDLYRTQDAGDANLLLSPYSIQNALAMTYAGADGSTRAEMQRVLHFPEKDEALHEGFAALADHLSTVAAASVKRVEAAKKQGGPGSPIELRVANRLFAKTGYQFRPAYFDLLQRRYGAPVELLDFSRNEEQARTTINRWVEAQTKDKIRELIPPGALNADTRLVLVNALYLRAPWADEFSMGATKPLPFAVRGRERVDVPTMANTSWCGYAERKGCKIITRPYDGGALHFVIVLPDDPAGLAAVEREMTPALLEECARLEAKEIVLFLPKFRLEPPTIPLGDHLKKLGMKSAFDEPRGSANFDRMAPRTPEEYLYVSAVLHKTFLALDEEGTEAAAATAVMMAPMAAAIQPAKPPEVRVDRPFLFAIQHRESGACLFLGRVTDPR